MMTDDNRVQSKPNAFRVRSDQAYVKDNDVQMGDIDILFAFNKNESGR